MSHFRNCTRKCMRDCEKSCGSINFRNDKLVAHARVIPDTAVEAKIIFLYIVVIRFLLIKLIMIKGDRVTIQLLPFRRGFRQ